MMQKRKLWFKNEILDDDVVKVHAMSPTAQFGLNVFEGLRGYWNKNHCQLFVFRLDDHLKRLRESGLLIGMDMPHDTSFIHKALRETIEVNNFKEDIAVRIIMLVDGEGTWSDERSPDMLIAPIAKPRMNIDKPVFKRACISSWQRIHDSSMPPRAKVGANYLNGRYAQLDARKKGYDLPILLGQDGKLSESAGSCLFIIKNGVLITPSATNSILESITRDTIIQLAQDANMKIDIRPIDRTEALLADEAFLCGSAAEITPLSCIDHFELSTVFKGSVTQKITKLYFDAVSQPGQKNAEWLWSAY
ncbi:MAG: aminotransferase class IV [Rhodothermales bacterium]